MVDCWVALKVVSKVDEKVASWVVLMVALKVVLLV